MKRTLLILATVAFLASCSTPKYSYNFDHYNYNAGKKKPAKANEFSLVEGPQAIQSEMLTASTSAAEVVELAPIAEAKATTVKKPYAEMTKAERKELRTYLKAETKNSLKARKASVDSPSATSGMDSDLKLAAVFGAVGIVALIISGQVFYIIGGIALLIGVVFFVKWLIRQ